MSEKQNNNLLKTQIMMAWAEINFLIDDKTPRENLVHCLTFMNMALQCVQKDRLSIKQRVDESFKKKKDKNK